MIRYCCFRRHGANGADALSVNRHMLTICNSSVPPPNLVITVLARTPVVLAGAGSLGVMVTDDASAAVAELSGGH